MSDMELDELVRDIQENGQREPATTWQSADGKAWLLDGRHRAIAARRLGRSLHTVQFIGDEDEARALVMSLNIRRRHLSASQRALAAGALARRQRGGVRGSGRHAAGLPNEVTPTQQAAAAMAGVSERLVRDGSLIINSGLGDLIEAVAQGETTVTAAAAAIRTGKRDRQAATALYLTHRRSSSSDAWLTPGWLLDRAASCLGGIDGDVAAESERRVPARWWLTAEDDALAQESWANADGSPSRLWMNPPYGNNRRGPGAWTSRMVEEWRGGSVRSALMLLPARPGSHWQHKLAEFPRVELTGHVRFEPGEGNPAREEWSSGKRHEAPFASILVGVGIDPESLHRHFGDVGIVWTAYAPTR